MITVPGYVSFTGDGVLTRTVTLSAGSTTLQVTYSIPKTVYTQGQTIPLTLTVTNIGSATYTYSLCGLSETAYASGYPIGSEVWESTYGTALPLPCLAGQTIAPGQSVTDQLTWTGINDNGAPIPAGTYAVYVQSGRIPQGEMGAYFIPPIEIGVGTNN